MARVKLEGVRKVYENGAVAVHGVDLEVADGELVVLVGPSGCGKSTTLRMVAGLESVSDGQLSIGDRVVNDMAPKERDIAMVFQNYALYPHMSVRENMAFALKLRKLPRGDIDARVREAADILEIGAILDRKPKQLSGGQRQRVAIGRAIVRHPQVFLFDEPLSNLDAKLRVQMRREIATLHRQLGATMIYVTHDQVEAMTLGDRIVVMSAGRVQQIDAPLDLYERPRNKFVAGFIGSPAMNFVDGTVVRDGDVRGLHFRAEGGGLDLELTEAQGRRLAGYAGKRVTAGIRPEDISIAGSAHAGGPAARASVRLDVVEPLGNEVLLHGRAGAHDMTARIAPQRLPAPGAVVDMAFDLAKMHFFDPETGEVVPAE